MKWQGTDNSDRAWVFGFAILLTLICICCIVSLTEVKRLNKRVEDLESAMGVVARIIIQLPEPSRPKFEGKLQ
jgi:hypothetical protein